MRYLFFLSILINSAALAQDTVTVYFDFGSAKISDLSARQLTDIPTRYDLSEVDSVQFIGYADSVGNLDANLRLSRKRAKQVQDYCKFVFKNVSTTSVLAKGEGSKALDSLNRRVDVILFSVPEKIVQPKPDEILEDVDPRCFMIDYEALQYCNIRTIVKGRKEYVYIEAMNHSLFHERQHYYVIWDSKGKATIRAINWKEKTTGKLWWKKERLVATIPKTSFDRFQFFTLQKGPCSGCKETIFTKDTIIYTTDHLYPDFFLMDNMQVKVRFLGGNSVKLRVPREYVDPSVQYYYSYPESASQTDELNWETKNGKKREQYYYAKVEIVNGKMPQIVQNRPTTVCKNSWPGRPWEINCAGYTHYHPCKQEFQFNVNSGLFYHNDSLTGFFTLGVSHTWPNANLSINGGVNTRLGFYGNTQFRYYFLHFPFKAISPENEWQAPAVAEPIYNYGRMYLGTELRTSYNRDYQSFLEGNVHLGVAYVRTMKNAFLPKIYIQGGIANDFMNRINTRLYPYGQIGLSFNISSLFIHKRIGSSQP